MPLNYPISTRSSIVNTSSSTLFKPKKEVVRRVIPPMINSEIPLPPVIHVIMLLGYITCHQTRAVFSSCDLYLHTNQQGPFKSSEFMTTFCLTLPKRLQERWVSLKMTEEFKFASMKLFISKPFKSCDICSSPLFFTAAPAPHLLKVFHEITFEDLLPSLPVENASMAVLREIDLSVQQGGRSNITAHLPPVAHLDTEYKRFKLQFHPTTMR